MLLLWGVALAEVEGVGWCEVVGLAWLVDWGEGWDVEVTISSISSTASSLFT